MKNILMDTFASKAKKLGFSVDRHLSDRKVYQIARHGKSFITIGKHFPLNSVVAYNLAKRKNLTKLLLRKAEIPVPGGIITSDWYVVLDALKNTTLTFPLVAKPDNSSLGKLVTAKINSLQELKLAFDRIHKKFGEVLVEEYCPGEDYRFLVLDDKVLTVAHRILPYVTGDGKATIGELIEKYNTGRKDELQLGYEVKRVLREQKLEADSIPTKDQKVLLRRNANVHTGGGVETVSVFDPGYEETALKAAHVLGLRFCGVDIISPDITKLTPGYKVIELNADPDYSIHWQVTEGEKFDPTKNILEALL